MTQMNEGCSWGVGCVGGARGAGTRDEAARSRSLAASSSSPTTASLDHSLHHQQQPLHLSITRCIINNNHRISRSLAASSPTTTTASLDHSLLHQQPQPLHLSITRCFINNNHRISRSLAASSTTTTTASLDRSLLHQQPQPLHLSITRCFINNHCISRSLAASSPTTTTASLDHSLLHHQPQPLHLSITRCFIINHCISRSLAASSSTTASLDHSLLRSHGGNRHDPLTSRRSRQQQHERGHWRRLARGPVPQALQQLQYDAALPYESAHPRTRLAPPRTTLTDARVAQSMAASTSSRAMPVSAKVACSSRPTSCSTWPRTWAASRASRCARQQQPCLLPACCPSHASLVRLREPSTQKVLPLRNIESVSKRNIALVFADGIDIVAHGITVRFPRTSIDQISPSAADRSEMYAL